MNKWPGGCITCVAFSPDDELKILTSTTDETSILRDAQTGEKLRSYTGRAIGFTPDGSQVEIAVRGDTIRLCSAATGQELAQLISFDAGKDWLVVTPDGVFDGSENARRKYVRFRDTKDPMKVVPPEQGFADYYHPNLLADILAGHAVAPPPQKNAPAAGEKREAAPRGGGK